ncbi:hypothetical protein FGM00_09320 [Aggregatimonas sangjinii]|uniref:Uncharacterized protein n=2 Tax=Aggregatimonas sangjinii TaxID=2583587 RepID=A0A5B7SUY6_9FLAO|nr:hypothetical protein FGM00_09320 [Aggregatimonas sangjinii]
MRTDRDLLIKGIRFLSYTVILMFTAPFAVYQAFKNQEHPLYIPVLVLGCILALAAIVMGFVSIKTIIDAFFGKKKKK